MLFPTETEASTFASPDVLVAVSGVGLTAASYSTAQLIHRYSPDLCILAGTAGSYPHSGLKVADSVLVASVVEADLGVFTRAGFVPMTTAFPELSFPRRGTLNCPELPGAPFPTARCASVNAAMAPFIDTSDIDIEDMESAAFGFVCQAERQPFAVLRTVSNVVGDAGPWDLDQAVRTLTTSLHRLIDFLRRAPEETFRRE